MQDVFAPLASADPVSCPPLYPQPKRRLHPYQRWLQRKPHLLGAESSREPKNLQVKNSWKRCLRSLTTFPQRFSARRRIHHKIASIDAIIFELQVYYKEAQDTGNDSYAYMASASIYLLDLERDLLGLMKGSLFEVGAQTRREVAGRLMALQLYEASRNVPRLMGKLLKNMVAELPEDAEHRRDIEIALRAIHIFYGQQRPHMNRLRSLKRAQSRLDGYRHRTIMTQLSPWVVDGLLCDFEKLMAGVLPTLGIGLSSLSRRKL